MTDRIALVLALVLLLALAFDFALLDGHATLFLARRFVVVVDWVMFWR